MKYDPLQDLLSRLMKSGVKEITLKLQDDAPLNVNATVYVKNFNQHISREEEARQQRARRHSN